MQIPNFNTFVKDIAIRSYFLVNSQDLITVYIRKICISLIAHFCSWAMAAELMNFTFSPFGSFRNPVVSRVPVSKKLIYKVWAFR